jgi:signal transduction histidine kinase
LRQAAVATDAIDLGIDAEDLSAQVNRILRNLLGIADSALLVLNHERQLVDVSKSGRARAVEGLPILEGSDVAELFSGRVPIIEFDEQHDRLFATSGRALLGVPWAQAAIPLRTQRDLIGVLLIGYRDGKPFLDEEDILVLGMVSRAVATTLQRRSLVRDLRERNEEASLLSQELLRVREDERKRIARDLHDEVIQNLIAVSYGLATIEHPPGPALRDQVLHVIERARTVCFDLRQFQQDTLGLGGAVRHVAEEFVERTGLRTLAHVAEDPGVVVPESLSTALLGILEEALNNAGRHAQASLVDIWINVTAESVRLRVCDNGVGFDRLKQTRGERATRHFGLAMMDERAALVGGQLEVRSAPGNGTEVVFVAALTQADARYAA